MASTMAISHIATLPNFHGPMPTAMAGHIHGSLHGGYPPQVPVTIHGPVMPGSVMTANNSQPATLSPPLQTVRLPFVPVGGGCYNDGMEVVWHGEFSRLFSSFFPPHVWYLSITNAAPQEKWKFYRDSAKVRFCCQDCGNGWTSMKGRVTFWFHLNTATSEGFVQFKLYGQVCKKCNSGKFEYVMWYPEEVSKVMCNLYNKVGQTFYGFLQPPIRIDRRPGRPRNQHNADLCQACRDGECDQGRPVKPLFNYFPPGVAPRPLNPPIPGYPPIVTSPNQLPLVIRQTPIPHQGPMLMHGGASCSGGQVIQPPPSGPSFITAPVTLTSGVQPILTYSIVTAPTKDAPKLAPMVEAAETKADNTDKPTEVTSSEGNVKPTSQPDKKPTPNPAANAVKKSHAITIKSPLVNGVEHQTVDDAPDLKPAINGHAKPINVASLPKLNDKTKKAVIVIPPIKKSAQCASTPEKKPTEKPLPTETNPAEKVAKASIVMNGYAAAAGKPLQRVNVVNGAV